MTALATESRPSAPRAPDSPLRIAFVCPRYIPLVGGIETHVEMLAKKLAAQGNHVEVLTQQFDPAQATEETLDGVVVRRFPLTVASQHYEFSLALWRFLWTHRSDYDVVHAHNYHSVLALGAAIISRGGFVFTPHYHGTAQTRFRRALHLPYRLLGARIIKRASVIVCVSPYEARLLERHFPSATGQIRVIPNGVDFDAIARAEPFETQHTVILSAGRLVEYKQVDVVIRALDQLGQNCVLRVIGEGADRPRLEAIAGQSGLTDRIEFLGRVDTATLYRWFRTATVYVTMSGIEAMPVTPLEVLAAGGRVVASDIAAHRNVADSTGGTMTLVPLDATPEAVALAIEAAINGPAASLPRVLSWQEVAEETSRAYASAMEGKPISRRA